VIHVTLFIFADEMIKEMENDCRNCPFNSKAATTLSDGNFDQLSANHLVLGFKRGDSIIKQGMYSTNVVFLRTGLAKIHLQGPYHEQIVRVVKSPTYLGFLPRLAIR